MNDVEGYQHDYVRGELSHGRSTKLDLSTVMTDITSMQPKTMTHEQILVMASVLIAMWIMLVFGQKITSFVIQLLFGSKK